MIQQNTPTTAVVMNPQPTTKPPVQLAENPKVDKLSPKEATSVAANGSKGKDADTKVAADPKEIKPENKVTVTPKKEEEKKPVQKVQDKSKPVSSTPIAGTPW